MKRTMMMLTILMSLLFSLNSFAQDEVKTIIEKKDAPQSSEKNSRRKKVQMCQECGKPETECECDGHGDEESHDDDE